MTEEKNYLTNGALLKDRYKVEENIGKNAIGYTYIALDCRTNRKVVIKQLTSQKVIDTYTVLHNAGPLDGLVWVGDLFAEADTTYAVMEYVDGITLEEYFRKSSGRFKMERIRDLLDPVLRSLITLSAHGIIHGNISPDNFVFTVDGKLKLIGFGQINGKVSDHAKAFAPPELFDENADGNEASDIYSICACIYRCITGVNPPESMSRIENDPCAKPSELQIAIEEGDEAALMMGMNPDRSRRLLKITALYRALYHTQPSVQNQKVENPVQIQEMNTGTPAQHPAVDDGRTEIIQPNYVQQNPAVLSQGVNPQAMNMQADGAQRNAAGKKKNKKKKKGNTLLIVMIVAGILVAIVLGVFTVLVATDYLSDDSDNTITEFFGRGHEDDDEEADGETSEEEDADPVGDLMAEGRYEDALKEIVDAKMDEEDGAEPLQKAIDELYAQCISESSALAGSGDFDAAFSMIDERIQYFSDIADKTGYVKNPYETELSDHRNQLGLKCVDAMYQKAQECANYGDENGMLDALDKASAYADAAEIESQKVKLYVTLVLVNMTKMSSSGQSASDIMKYIDDNLGKAGNNCRLMEFWHYYDDIYHKQLGTNRMKVTGIRVSSEGYILPDSNLRELAYSDLNSLSQYELYFALYEIYARHGRIFTDTAVSDQFQKYSWYHGTISPENFDENELSDVEKKNINTIISYQRDMGYR